jgi:hypothetical protein
MHIRESITPYECWEKWIPGPRLTAHPGMTCPATSTPQYSRDAIAPESCMHLDAPKSEGAGNAGRVSAPAASRAKNKKHGELVHHGHTATSGIPRAMVLTVSFVLSPEIGLYCLRRRPRCRSIIANLASASRCQDHTTSPSALAPLVWLRRRVQRIPPRVRDDREPPLCGAGRQHL